MSKASVKSAIEHQDQIEQRDASSAPPTAMDVMSDEALELVAGGTKARGDRIKSVTVELYVENVEFNIMDTDA